MPIVTRHRILKALEFLSPRVAARIDWNLWGSLNRWGGPMNGQSARRALVRELVHEYVPDLIIETGTYRGATTEFLWSLGGCRTITVESNARHAAVARQRLAGLPDVDVIVGESTSVLSRIARPLAEDFGRPFFYLDAHWEDELPLARELEIIVDSWPRFAVLVDDFAVPSDPGYQYDDYGPGRRLSVEFLPSAVTRAPCAVLFPRTPSTEESGARRGCVFITNDRDLLKRLDEAASWWRWRPAE